MSLGVFSPLEFCGRVWGEVFFFECLVKFPCEAILCRTFVCWEFSFFNLRPGYIYWFERETQTHTSVWERNISWLPLVCVLIRDQTHNLGICFDQEWNPWPSLHRTTLQPSKPHWPGCWEVFCFLLPWLPWVVFCFVLFCFITALILLVVISVEIFLFYWFSFGKLYISRSLSILPSLSNLLA